MAHLIDKNLVERANTALVLGILWAALGTCVLGALAYDIRYCLEGWRETTNLGVTNSRSDHSGLIPLP
jgi:hypothetical protein